MGEACDETARLTADVVLFGRAHAAADLHVLLIQRRWAPFEGCWALPGGHVDAGELPSEAAYRELAEETGVRIGPILEEIGVYAEPARDPRGRYVTFAYTCQVGHLIPPDAADDAAEAEWWPVDELLAGPGRIAFDHERIIRDALRQVRW